ncbi:molybdopterin molybdotransferase MoeA [Cupriavidus gilardii]|uniref:Molybdopterin molybdenumtransferase n=1 Tax=Cupriavidus gilardii TaxID=82541 RepID=A0A849BIA7_9BURK|nr:gephyrin-like molybdotransferase Glp [Cupriavidus gilardii]ALD91087.1 molybdenum cofactor biosynthesis protein A [Cupriavidus gilardii CR3]KAB0597248.1 molybdopterin molybdotransferase MoeA [Cupriavidus gilardii]MCT9012260.1 molybdopterin molybdotransferase MoeA [Cupriavidus gilardii]MCT9053603.1 molybdopterin molybdotransferase MoeA [Cupriavidus gilardii]MCT9114785.1 molybdopterin molybdotransferase MoeA [Cupriavidus gilardii]
MPSLQSVISCLSDYDPSALPVAQANRIIADVVEPVSGIEHVAIRAALDRVLAEDVVSPLDVPAHDNSAMDGYAFASAALQAASGGEVTLRVIGTALAGEAHGLVPAAGEAVRIMTGAVMPAGCDTVIPQEFTQRVAQGAGEAAGETAGEAAGETVRFAADAVRAGDNRRLRGEDLARGKPALRQGRVLQPADLGLLASLGIAEVKVRRRLRVAFFSTGDELRSIGEPLDAGCVYDSNRYTLHGMLRRLHVDLIDMGVVRDDPAALEAALRSACENADAVITSGGVSVGEADYTKQIMAELGDVTFWKIAMRPGRPMAFGRIASNGHQALLFGLPGNPVAVMVTFYHFVRAALHRMMGADISPPPLMRVRSAQAIRKKPGRTEYQRGILARGADGQWEVRITGQQGSGVLRSMSEANCFIVLAHEQGGVAAGDPVEVMLFEGLL